MSTIEAPEVSLFEIELYDNTGKLRKLSEVAADNKVVLLSFTVYGAEPSPAYNVELNKVYDRYSKNGLEIYQVGLDEDEYRWKQSARNLPWITVYNSASDGVKESRQLQCGVAPDHLCDCKWRDSRQSP